jgi:hypothetical protein
VVLLAACGDDDGMVTPDAGGAVDGGDLDSGTVADAGTGDDGGTGDAGSPVDGGDVGPLRSYCEARARRSERCGDDPQPVDECIVEDACLGVIGRPDAVTAIAGCIDALECDTSDDGCATAAGAGYEPAAGAAAFSERCIEVRTTCGGGFSDDLCFAEPVRDETIEELDSCLDEECEMVGACIVAIYTCG